MTWNCGMLWRSALNLAGLFGLTLGMHANAADDLTVEAKASGRAVAVEVRATIHAPRDLIWATLTDYDHLAEFVPGMHSSRTIEHRGPVAIVEQEGEAGFLFFSYAINVVVASAEYPPDLIELHVLSGNLRRLDGSYRLTKGALDGTWVLTWSGLIEPSLPVPSFLGVGLMRRNVETQFAGMVAEVERRQTTALAESALLATANTRSEKGP